MSAMNWKSIIIVLGSIILQLQPWITQYNGKHLDMLAVYGLATIVVGNVVSWFTKSPDNPLKTFTTSPGTQIEQIPKDQQGK